MPAVTFNDSGSCLGQIRQVLSALRAQLRAEGQVKGTVQISILVKTNVNAPEETTEAEH